MRLGTVLTLGLAGAVGIGLFYAKHRVQALEDELTALQQQIVEDREAIHVLNAEWSYLNDPDRLAELSRRYLDLVPMRGRQLATLAEVPEKFVLPLPELPPGRHDAPLPDAAPQIASASPAAPEPVEPAPVEPAPVVSAPAMAAPVIPAKAVTQASAPAPAPTAGSSIEPAPAPESPFADLPADVQAVLASMRRTP